MIPTTILTTALAATAFAAPLCCDPCTATQPVLTARVSSRSNDFINAGCAPIIMIFARGSTEDGNMGTVCGPQTGQALKDIFGAANVAVQGVEYLASISTNFLPGGADPAGVAEMQLLISLAVAECPASKLVVGGYSQGAALTHRALESMKALDRDHVVAAFLYGDTQFAQVG